MERPAVAYHRTQRLQAPKAHLSSLTTWRSAYRTQTATSLNAIQAIYISINQKPKFVLDADIAKCFDRINHTALLSKLHTFPLLRQAVKGWLKAGVMEDGAWFPTEEGSPQGGICSPLLAN